MSSNAFTSELTRQTFIEAFETVAEAERQRVDSEVAAKKAARVELQTEYEKRASQLDQEVAAAEKERNRVWSDLGSISTLQISTQAELSKQVDESLKVA